MKLVAKRPEPARSWPLAALSVWLLLSASTASADDKTLGIKLLQRLTWGVSAASLERYSALGREKWIDEQLADQGPPTLPKEAEDQIEAFSELKRSPLELSEQLDQQVKSSNQILDPEQKKAAQRVWQQALIEIRRRTASREILRALYAREQIRERLVWFWFNHFSVYGSRSIIPILLPDYLERTLRPHALGRFRDLLSATLRHPAMLRYLDNAQNAVGHLNENYAREIMELHTLGVGGGYTQHDVEELARILTGFGVNQRPGATKVKPELQPQLVRDGLFEFNPQRHDYGDKVFLGRTIKGRGIAEAEEALDLLCEHPSTARFISRKLATYFVADDPPEDLVGLMAGVFTRTHGDIRAVMSAMIRSPDFEAALTKQAKFKDPMRYLLSSVRLAYDEKVIVNTGPIQNWLARLGEGLFDRSTPDGYPLASSAWNGPGQMMVRFEIARQLGGGSAGLFKPEGPGAVDRPAIPLLQNQLYFSMLRQTLKPETAHALDDAVSPQDWNTLFLSSPDFMY